jgi:translation initiation factor 5B
MLLDCLTIETYLLFDCGYQSTVLEVKVIEGYGTTLDVVLVKGVLREGDQIVVSGMQASISDSNYFC